MRIFAVHPFFPANPEPDYLLMMPKRKNALFVLLFTLVSYAVLTAAPLAPSPLNAAFNGSLRETTGKSNGYLIGDMRYLIADRKDINQISPIKYHQSDIQKVVIDAGHGGKDPGGMGANSMEKHIALSIAQLLSIGIRTNFPDVEVILTRNDDTFIPLHERADIANKAGADLFISIHANIMPGSSATRGTETFVMGQHVAKHNLDVAKRENAAILLEGGDVKTNYGFDPNSDEGHIMMSMFQHAFLERSIQFAELVEKEFGRAGRKSRGVKQAGFVVLKATTMPAVLIETGFMSNPDEEAYLLSSAGQRKLANALLKAFGAYYKQLGGEAVPTILPPVTSAPLVAINPRRTAPSRSSQATPPPQTNTQTSPTGRASVFGKEIDLPTTTPPVARQRQWTAKGVDERPLTYQSKPSVYNYIPPVPTQGALPTAKSPIANRPTVASDQQLDVLRRQVSPYSTPPSNRVVPGTTSRLSVYGTPLATTIASSKTDSVPGGYAFRKAKAKANGGVDLRTIPDSQLLYAVQIAATKKVLDLTERRFTQLPYPIKHFTEGGFHKYQARNLPTAAATKQAKATIKQAGFFDAMIVVYFNGKRLGAEQVRYLLGR
ncbi:MAG: N-acetylmuramoyl-L-alanine amidase [Bacteroidota bacterium]